MPDYQYFKNRKECTEKILHRIQLATKETPFLAAELHWIAIKHGYGPKFVDNVLRPMVEFDQIKIVYKEKRAYQVIKI